MNGEGNKHYPSLFHNTVTGADRSDNLLSAIIFGVNRTVDGETAFMPGFEQMPSTRISFPIRILPTSAIMCWGNTAIRMSK